MADSAESITASVPSRMALDTSVASARVGSRCAVIDSSICVAVITGRARLLARRMMLNAIPRGTDTNEPVEREDRIRGYQIAKNVGLILRLSKRQRQRIAHRQHSLHPAILNDGQVTDMVRSHQLLRAPHAVIGTTSHDSCCHNVANPYVLHFSPVGSRERPHEIPFRDDADHLSVTQFANRQRTDLVCKHAPCNRMQRIVWQARY